MSLNGPDGVVRFMLDGQKYEIARSEVEARLASVRPRSVGTHAVKINGTWYPVRQAFEVASGIPAALFNSHTARRHLASLGLELRGDIQHRDGSTSPVAGPPMPHPAPGDVPPVAEAPWHTEALVQAAVVVALEANGWHIVSQADTATKERGIDVVASRDGQLAGIEVKGFPTRTYADPRRQAETKPTQPSTQAGHWYSQAVLAAMRLRTRRPEYLSVIALPDFNRYRALFEETRSSLDAAGIHLWWVHSSGTVEGL
jgi:Holliday junction resolvase-like predicted endonuclease